MCPLTRPVARQKDPQHMYRGEWRIYWRCIRNERQEGSRWSSDKKVCGCFRMQRWPTRRVGWGFTKHQYLHAWVKKLISTRVSYEITISISNIRTFISYRGSIEAHNGYWFEIKVRSGCSEKRYSFMKNMLCRGGCYLVIELFYGCVVRMWVWIHRRECRNLECRKREERQDVSPILHSCVCMARAMACVWVVRVAASCR